jgi:hypothetical protein
MGIGRHALCQAPIYSGRLAVRHGLGVPQPQNLMLNVHIRDSERGVQPGVKVLRATRQYQQSHERIAGPGHTHLSPITIASSSPPALDTVRVDSPFLDLGLLVWEHEPTSQLSLTVRLRWIPYTRLPVKLFFISTRHSYESADVFSKPSSYSGFAVVSVDGGDDL